MAPTLHLMVGLPGAGKTTRARELEVGLPALRLTPDEWITAIYGRQPSREQLDGARDPVEALQWDVAARALALGIDVILDFGFWTRTEREAFRRRAAELGASCRIHFVDPGYETLVDRLTARTRDRPSGTFEVSLEDLQRWSAIFEPPGPEELAPQP